MTRITSALRYARLDRCLLPVVVAIAFAGTCRAVDLSGQWRGHWENSNNPHTGPIRATLTRINDTQYRADFAGRFFKLLPFRYSVILNAVEDGDTVRLEGSQQMGRFGTFCYGGTATCQKWVTTYKSPRFSGRFVLQR